MLTRVHISSFVGLTVLVWIVALWLQGQPVLSSDFLKPFGTVVGGVSITAAIFNKWAWSWPIFRGWYVRRPDIRGTWQTVLSSEWIDPTTNERVAPIDGYVVIRQTFSNLSVRLMTAESRSQSIAYSVDQQPDEIFSLSVVYRNEPEISLQGTKSEIHHGAFILEVHMDEPSELVGHYWTDRKTRGSMRCVARKRCYCTSFEKANAAFDDAGSPSK